MGMRGPILGGTKLKEHTHTEKRGTGPVLSNPVFRQKYPIWAIDRDGA